ncbi:MAG: TFIIB-type zinc ribbon-containing protein, partial [Thermoplasmatota archaeon]
MEIEDGSPDRRKRRDNRERVQIEETTKCPECGSEHIIRDYERGELVCGDCGIVINDLQIDMGPEWRAFDSVQTRNFYFPKEGGDASETGQKILAKAPSLDYGKYFKTSE